jgi:FkbM family methyltransferase
VSILESLVGDHRLRLVDVGARGGVAPRWKQFSRVLDVTAFEPDAAECDRLNQEAASLPYAIRYLPVALGREAAEAVPFHVTNWPVASSVYRPNAEFLRAFPDAEKLLEVREIETIAVETLDGVARREGLVADCLKVDVEGAALDVLFGAESTLRETLVLEIEAELNPLFDGEALFPEVDSHLRGRGWVLEGLRRTSWRRGERLDRSASGLGGQIVSVDALYRNEAPIKRGLDLTRELKLLVILSAYEQMDAVLTRLAELRQSPDGLTTDEVDELQRLLVPPLALSERFDETGLASLDSTGRRALADSLQPGDATVWEDPHFF